MMKVYLDEAGTDGKSAVFVLAGFIGTFKQWKKFDRLWWKILRRYGVADFHARHFYSRNRNGVGSKGSFNGWDTERFEAFLRDSMDAFQKAKLKPAGAVVRHDVFDSFSVDERRLLTGGRRRGRKWTGQGAPGKPYYCAMHACITYLLQKAVRRNDRVMFIFDDHRTLSVFAHECFNNLKEDLQQHFPKHAAKIHGDLLFSSRLDAPGIQLADLLAFLVNRHHNKGLNAEQKFVWWKFFERGSDLIYADRSLLETIADIGHCWPDSDARSPKGGGS